MVSSLNELDVLAEHRFDRASALNEIALQTARQADVEILRSEDREIALIPHVLRVKHEDTVKDYDVRMPARDASCGRKALVGLEAVVRDLHLQMYSSSCE